VNLDDLIHLRRGTIRVYVEDVDRKVGVRVLVKQVEDEFGKIEILINPASVDPHASLMDLDEKDWRRTLDVNLTAAFLLMHSVGRMMRPKGSGTIVNLIRLMPARTEHEAACRATMTGLISLNRAAAIEFAPLGIHVHAVGSGLAEFQRRDTSAPRNLIDAVIFLSNSELFGQIINVEDR